MRSLTFSSRTIKEILRDPLSYIFCIGFPVVMLIIMTVVNNSIPKQADMTVFNLNNLTPGIAVFGLTFIMLFASMQVAKDRTTALIIRLHASPMKPSDFIVGYTLPMLIIGLIQIAITYVAGIVISIFVDYSFNYFDLFLSILFFIPSLVMYISFGLIFGTLFSEKAAPGICSILISVVGMIGGIWMDIESIGGTIMKVGKVLPFYRGVKCGRMVVNGSLGGAVTELLYTVLWAVAFYVIAIYVMNRKLKKDIM